MVFLLKETETDTREYKRKRRHDGVKEGTMERRVKIHVMKQN